MNEERITISEERYKELVKMKAKVELAIIMCRKDKYFGKRDFMNIFMPEEEEKDE